MLKLLVVACALLGTVLGSNEPNGFSRRKYALEKPEDVVKTSEPYSLGPGECRPVYITEDIDGKYSRRSIESQIYTRVESDSFFSVSIVGSDGLAHSHPKVKVIEHSSYWPDILVCNPNELTSMSFTVSYANDARTPVTLAALAIALVVAVLNV
ncbi:MAG: hypothetical protein MHM6MM_003708 [Cercozoa sp. M6MM]